MERDFMLTCGKCLTYLFPPERSPALPAAQPRSDIATKRFERAASRFPFATVTGLFFLVPFVQPSVRPPPDGYRHRTYELLPLSLADISLFAFTRRLPCSGSFFRHSPCPGHFS